MQSLTHSLIRDVLDLYEIESIGKKQIELSWIFFYFFYFYFFFFFFLGGGAFVEGNATMRSIQHFENHEWYVAQNRKK